jgi:hypothetical protein
MTSPRRNKRQDGDAEEDIDGEVMVVVGGEALVKGWVVAWQLMTKTL